MPNSATANHNFCCNSRARDEQGDHFRRTNSRLVRLITSDRALTHAIVFVELACAAPPAARERTLHDIGLLQHATHPTWVEVMELIDARNGQLLVAGMADVEFAKTRRS